MYNENYSRLDALEAQNIALRKQLGEFGFFGPNYLPPRLTDIREDIENKLTVREWKLINNMSISYTPDQIKECVSILNRLVSEGVFDTTAPYYTSYYNFGNPTPYPPMGAGVVADPAITKELTPQPEDTKNMIIMSGMTERISVPTYSGVGFTDHGTRIEIETDKVGVNSLSYIKLRLTESIKDKNVVTINIPEKCIEDAHNTFKGHYDYIESNVLITCPTTITLISSDIKYVDNIINCTMKLFAKIYDKDIAEVNNENPGLITAVEDDEEVVTNNESD